MKKISLAVGLALLITLFTGFGLSFQDPIVKPPEPQLPCTAGYTACIAAGGKQIPCQAGFDACVCALFRHCNQ